LAHANENSIAHMIVITLIKDVRVDLPLLGTRKAYQLLAPELAMHHIKMGRDKLFDLLRFHGLLITNRKRMVKRINTNH
jgi:putative transposase